MLERQMRFLLLGRIQASCKSKIFTLETAGAQLSSDEGYPIHGFVRNTGIPGSVHELDSVCKSTCMMYMYMYEIFTMDIYIVY